MLQSGIAPKERSMPAERMRKPRAMVRPLEDMLASTPAFPCGRGESRQREDSGGHELMTFSHTVMSTFGSLVASPLYYRLDVASPAPRQCFTLDPVNRSRYMLAASSISPSMMPASPGETSP